MSVKKIFTAPMQNSSSNIPLETCCDWNPDTDGIVQNCKVAFHNDRREQTDLIYADYFLTEAVLRLLGKDFLIW